MFILAIALLLLAMGCLFVGKAFFYVPQRELKRRAARGDKLAGTLYRAAAYGSDLKLLLWTLIAVTSAAGFLLFARIAPPWLGFVVIVLALVLTYLWLPRTRPAKAGVQLAQWLTPLLVQVLRRLHPLLRRVGLVLDRLGETRHTGLFEREDVYELIEWQRHQRDSRLSDSDLIRMRGVLELGDAKVRNALVPRKDVKTVAVDEVVSPGLVNELYSSKHSFFPVYEDKTTNIVGLLSLDHIADMKRKGTVRDSCSLHVAYVHEEDSLEQALRALGDSRQHLLVVVNSSNEYVGVITLNDITHWLLGAADESAPTDHDDREAVAARHGRRSEPSKMTEEIPPSSEGVVQ